MREMGSSSSESERRVLRFRRGPAGVIRPMPPPADDLAKYTRGGETDDYRHRMIVNLAAFLFVIVLIGIGLWLAETMAELRRNQDCVLSGRRNCLPVEDNRDRYCGRARPIRSVYRLYPLKPLPPLNLPPRFAIRAADRLPVEGRTQGCLRKTSQRGSEIARTPAQSES
jgi:hypothetical protein